MLLLTLRFPFNTMNKHISSSFTLPVDITVYHNGFHGDLNETFFVGEVDEGAKKLVQTTYECLMQAIDSGRLRPGFPSFTRLKFVCI